MHKLKEQLQKDQVSKMRKRKDNYATYVKDYHMPKISDSKVSELQKAIEDISHPVRDRKQSQDNFLKDF